MSHATEQARSTRSDARAFADAFADADGAFGYGPDAGESRTLTLAELGDELATRSGGPSAAASVAPADDELLTLAELGDALARPVRDVDALDFDFGTSAHERARRRTAARFQDAPPARRQASGTGSTGPLGHHADARPAGTGRFARATALESRRITPPADPRQGGRFARSDAAARAAMVDAAASAADRLSKPTVARHASTSEHPRAPTAVPRLREVEPRQPHDPRSVADRFGGNPDRIAMWAVLLGIVLVLIAFTSGSSSAVALPLLAAL